MQTKSPHASELQEFLTFARKRLSNGEVKVSVAECVEEFRKYQSDLGRVQKDIQPAIEQLDNGQGREIPLQEFCSQAREQSAKNAN